MSPGGKSRRRKLILLAIAAGVVVLVLVWMPLWAVRAVSKAFPGTIWMAKTGEPLAAITFDDGPDPVYTPQVLDILKRHNARATFFLMGERARHYPELVARIRAEGHEIGNHTDSEKTTLYMSTERFEKSLLRAEETLRMKREVEEAKEVKEVGDSRKSTPVSSTSSASPTSLKFLRPAGGLIRPAQLRAAREHGYTVVMGSAYGWDPVRPPAAYIRWAIAKNLRPGAIAILHDAGGNRSNSVAALEGILAEGERKGLRWVTLSELLDSQNEPPMDADKRRENHLNQASSVVDTQVQGEGLG
jgi:peptidoglycan/xylan/chitin deacetylase (PgdA/CDA1 family)